MTALAQIRPLAHLMLPVLFALALVRPAHAETLSMIWVNAATSQAYEVTAPDESPLLTVKQQVMSDIGLSVLQSPLYAVEKKVVTTTAVRGQYDPVTGLPLVITTEEYLLLSESETLLDLEIASGDTLRLRQIAFPEDPVAEDDTGGDTGDEVADGSAEDADDVEPVKSCHRRHCNDKRHHHHRHGKHHKHGGKHRFG